MNKLFSRHHAPVIFLLSIPSGLLLWQAWVYYPFLADDALISLRYADRLIQGHGLTWTDGTPVEGYSNLLWVLLVAAGGYAGFDLVNVARGLGVIATLVPLLVVAMQARSLTPQQYIGLLVAMCFYSLAVPTAAWAVGGLEQASIAALLAIAMPGIVQISVEQHARGSAGKIALLALGLLAISRPDGPLFTVVFALSFVLLSLFRHGLRHTWGKLPFLTTMLLVPTAFYLAQLVFRLWYYGEWVPNTALVKLAPSAEHYQRGWWYVTTGLHVLSPWPMIAGFCTAYGILAAPCARNRTIALYSALGFLLWCAYLVVIGGDIFPAWRHLVPLLVLMLFVTADVLPVVFGARPSRAVFAALLLVSALSLWSFYREQRYDPLNDLARTERWEFEGKAIGLVLKAAYGPQQPLVAVTAAGCIPYWSGLPSLDMLGLNDYYLPRHPPADFGKGIVGHELGNGRYVMSQNPDIVIFNTGIPGPAFRSAEEMYAMPEFKRKYAAVRISNDLLKQYGKGGYGFVWLNRESPKLGITYRDSSIEVPAVFINEFHAFDVTLHDNTLVAEIAFNKPARGSVLRLPGHEGPWQCQAVTVNDAPAECALTKSDAFFRLAVTVPASYGNSVLLRKLILSPAAASR